MDLAGVFLPPSLNRKYPDAGIEWSWYWVFPSQNTSIDPRSRFERRHHVSSSPYQKAIRNAGKKAGINKSAFTHMLWHSFVTHLLDQGRGIRTV
ncbi:MAG: hypothetical protein CMI18_00295 [Opitutaceae bacterium]|nr:hypothetical protein [Opitutaceae bacterium]